MASTSEHLNPSQEEDNERTLAQHEDEETFIIFNDEDVQEGLKECHRSVVGKIVTEKPIHKNSLHNALANIWCNPKGFRLEEVAEKTFHLFFESEKDVQRILQGSPWAFRNSWLLVKPWQRDTELKDINFQFAPIWIHLLGLPPHCRSKAMARKIGESMGEVIDSGIFELPDKSIILKVRVLMNISKALKKGVNGGSVSDGMFWVDFRYEKLPQFCFYCGKIGHGEQGCLDKQNDEEGKFSKQLGPWLRTTVTGRRI